MASLRKVVVTWTGGTGLPGVSVFYSAQADDVTTELGTFFNAIKGMFPPPLTWSIPASGDEISDVTGQLTGGWTGGTAASILSTGSTSYAAGTGTFIRWGTSTIVSGRRLKGRTFLCPLQSTSYDTDGTIFSSSVSTLNTASATLAGVGKLRIFHRPSSIVAANGSSSPVTSGACADLVTSLKTRRH